jgi:precorrin-2/cobalt-factor-2 C20-methyltransferase
MQYQQISTDIASIKNDKCDYFSMVLVTKREKDGILIGKQSAEAAGAST